MQLSLVQSPAQFPMHSTPTPECSLCTEPGAYSSGSQSSDHLSTAGCPESKRKEKVSKYKQI